MRTRNAAPLAVVALLAAACGTNQLATAKHTSTPTHAVSTSQPVATSRAAVSSSTPASKPTATSTRSPFPPKTYADLQSLYGLYGSARINVVQNEQVGLPACPSRSVVIVVTHSDSPAEIAGEMADAYFNDHAGDGVVFADYSAADASNGYTAGRLIRDSPCDNPGTNDFELDVGSDLQNTSYVITKGVPSS